MVRLGIKDYRMIWNSTKIYGICEILINNYWNIWKEARMSKKLEIEFRTGVITYELLSRDKGCIDYNFEVIKLKKVKGKDIKDYVGDKVDDKTPVVVGLDIDILTDVGIIMKILNGWDISTLKELTKLDILRETDIYIPKSKVNPIVVKLHTVDKYFGIIAPRIVYY